MNTKTNELAAQAKEGNRKALEALVKSIQNRIYRFSLKMVYQPQDAEDATQEILIRIITKLDSFRQESSFSTWAMTIAANHLKNRKQNRKENWFTFKRCEDSVLKELPDPSTLTHCKAEQHLIVEEMRIRCMQGLLQCLDTDHRIAYIIGSTMELSSPEGAAILNISPSAFRKRLSRARESIRTFLTNNCDLFDAMNPCNCKSQATKAIRRGDIQPEKLQFAGHAVSKPPIADIKKALVNLDTVTREVELMRLNQEFKPPGTFPEIVKQMLNVIPG